MIDFCRKNAVRLSQDANTTVLMFLNQYNLFNTNPNQTKKILTYPYSLYIPYKPQKHPQFPLEENSMPQNKMEKEYWSLI